MDNQLEDKITETLHLNDLNDLVKSTSESYNPLGKILLHYNANSIYSSSSVKESEGEKVHHGLGVEESKIQRFDIGQRGFISGETWNKVINLHSKIVQVTKESVSCECLIDKENQVFDTRTFPKELFSHLDTLAEGQLILINIKTKPGSSRIDILLFCSL